MECIAVAVASVCGFALNDATQRSLEIAERGRRRQQSEEYDQHEVTRGRGPGREVLRCH